SVRTLGADVPPVIEVAPEVSGSWLREIVVEVRAHDPDGDTLDRLDADLSDLPGATFTTSSDHTRGTLRWIPGIAASRPAPHLVTFTAANQRSASAGSRI